MSQTDDILAALKRELPAKPAPAASADAPTPPAQPPAGDRDQADDDQSNEQGDIKNASRFLADHNGRIFHRPSPDERHRAWYIWDGRRWKRDEAGAIMNLAEQTAKAISLDFTSEARQLEQEADKKDEADERAEAKAMRKAAARARAKSEQIQSLKRMEDFVRLASTRPEINRDPATLDANPFFLNCLNGTIDLRAPLDAKPKPHSPHDYITKLCPVDHVPGLADERLDRVVAHVTRNDPDVARYVQDVLGRSIIGNNDLEQFWLWWGPGGSGKGTLLESVKAALGDYCLTAEFQSFIKTAGARVRDDLDRLNEARVVLASEVEKGEQMAAGVVKMMTGNDTVTSRQLYGSYREFRPRMSLHLQCNDRPRVDDTDSGIWRRLVVIPCGDSVANDKRDPGLKNHLLDPKAGGRAILAWLVAGARRTWQKPRLDEPQAVIDATQAYRREQDPTAEFFRDDLRFAVPAHRDDTMCAAADLMDAYEAHCEGEKLQGKYRLTSHGIGKRLELIGCYQKKMRDDRGRSTRAWVGVTLVPQTGEGSKPHAFQVRTFLPTKKEHHQVIPAESEEDDTAESVPKFQSSGHLEKPGHARARPGDVGDFSKDKELWNFGTKKNTDQEELNDVGDLPHE
jgi:putative DNA primase/helicase